MKIGKYYRGKGKFVGKIGGLNTFATKDGCYSEDPFWDVILAILKNEPEVIISLVLSGIAAVVSLWALIHQ